MRRATKLLLGGSAATIIASVNAVAYLQARAMTRFSSAGLRTEPPEDLNLLEVAGVLLAGVNVPRPRNARSPASLGLPYEVHRFPTSHGETLEAWYVPGDPDRALVLAFHGYAASKSALLPVGDAVHALGHPILLVDFYGSGGSSGSGTSLGYLEAEDVAAAVQYARRTWPARRIVLYGFSMGGAAILRAIAVEGVHPDGVILEATFDTLLSTVKNRFHAIGLPATPLAEMLLFWGGVDWGFDAFAHNPADYGASVRCPTLMLHGESDARVPPEQAQRLQRSIPNARLVRFPGVPHMLIVQAHPELWKIEAAALLAGGATY